MSEKGNLAAGNGQNEHGNYVSTLDNYCYPVHKKLSSEIKTPRKGKEEITKRSAEFARDLSELCLVSDPDLLFEAYKEFRYIWGLVGERLLDSLSGTFPEISTEIVTASDKETLLAAFEKEYRWDLTKQWWAVNRDRKIRVTKTFKGMLKLLHVSDDPDAIFKDYCALKDIGGLYGFLNLDELGKKYERLRPFVANESTRIRLLEFLEDEYKRQRIGVE